MDAALTKEAPDNSLFNTIYTLGEVALFFFITPSV
jgi:hypothetical protein